MASIRRILAIGIIPRHQLVDLTLPMAVDDSGQGGAQVGQRIDSLELAGFDQRSDGRPLLCSRIVSGEESVLSVQRNRPDGPFDGIVVDLDPAVGQEDTEAIPVFGDIGQSFAERRLRADRSAKRMEMFCHLGP